MLCGRCGRGGGGGGGGGLLSPLRLDIGIVNVVPDIRYMSPSCGSPLPEIFHNPPELVMYFCHIM